MKWKRTTMCGVIYLIEARKTLDNIEFWRKENEEKIFMCDADGGSDGDL